MKEVQLYSGAWYRDEPLVLTFPDAWDVTVLGQNSMPALSAEQLRERLSCPIASPLLSTLAYSKKRAAIIVDDLTRPTPAAALLPSILQELNRAGLATHSVTIVIAGGTHKPASHDEICKKLGPQIPPQVKIVAHDSSEDLVYLGRSARGIPLYVNRAVMDCDLKIGVGCIYPHPAASFSGGSKIIMPAVCGAETTRSMHDYLKGARQRGESLETELRREIEEVAARVGLNFIVNVVLNQERQIAELFAGDRVLAHRQGVRYAHQVYSVTPVAGADIIVADMYPFDTSLQFAYDRGLWPVFGAKKGASKVIIAACPQGIGSHSLYPVSNQLGARISRRLKRLHPREFRDPIFKLKTAAALLKQKQLELMFLSRGITPGELKQVFPKAELYQTWPALLGELMARRGELPVKVAVYRCAPLYLPAGARRESQ